MLIFCLFHLYYVYAPRLQLSWWLYQATLRGWCWEAKRGGRKDPHAVHSMGDEGGISKGRRRSRRAPDASQAPSRQALAQLRLQSGPRRLGFFWALTAMVPSARWAGVFGNGSRGAGIFPTSNHFLHKDFSPQAPPSPQWPLPPSTATSWVERVTGEGK